MIKEIVINKQTAILDTEKFYSGLPNPDDENKNVRRAIGLPITKQIVFYKNKRDAQSIVDVFKYRIADMYLDNDNWFVIEIFFEDNTSEKIHSLHLIEMQKPSFISDMAKQSKEIDDIQ